MQNIDTILSLLVIKRLIFHGKNLIEITNLSKKPCQSHFCEAVTNISPARMHHHYAEKENVEKKGSYRRRFQILNDYSDNEEAPEAAHKDSRHLKKLRHFDPHK